MKTLIKQMERVGVYNSKVIGPRPKKSKEDKESIMSDRTCEPNSNNCTAEMAPRSKAQWAKEERQSKHGKQDGWGGTTSGDLPSPIPSTPPSFSTSQVVISAHAWGSEAMKLAHLYKRLRFQGKTHPMTTSKMRWFKSTRKYWPGTRALHDICHYQKCVCLLLKRAVFCHLVREIAQGDEKWFEV